jgi:hypothetical protein
MLFAAQWQEQADVEGIAGEAGSGLYFSVISLLALQLETRNRV